MLNLTRPSFKKIQELLLRQQKKVEADIKAVEADDPLKTATMELAESSEPGTDSWIAETHGRVLAVRRGLEEMLTRIKKSLMAIKSGMYGKCEDCKKMIEVERLNAMPTATLCIVCSKKTKK